MGENAGVADGGSLMSGQKSVEGLREEILATVDVQTSTEDPWTSTRAVVQAIDVDTDRVKSELQRAANSDQLLEWRGKVAPVDEDRLLAVIEERDADSPRPLLIGRANRLLREVRST
jgi:hypothetical protein